VYVRYRSEELYAIICLESHRHQAAIVGENLGTVPSHVNAALARHGIRTMYVVQYEAQPTAARPLRRVPLNAVASLNTHDMPPFAAYLRGRDFEDQLLDGPIESVERGQRALRGRLPAKGLDRIENQRRQMLPIERRHLRERPAGGPLSVEPGELLVQAVDERLRAAEGRAQLRRQAGVARRKLLAQARPDDAFLRVLFGRDDRLAPLHAGTVPHWPRPGGLSTYRGSLAMSSPSVVAGGRTRWNWVTMSGLPRGRAAGLPAGVCLWRGRRPFTR